jgi:hypothetical protein
MHTDAERTLADTLESHGQGHVLRHADSLSPADHKAFHAQLASIDLPLVSRLVHGGAEAKIDYAEQKAEWEAQQAARRPA